jgi:hypothetical protein
MLGDRLGIGRGRRRRRFWQRALLDQDVHLLSETIPGECRDLPHPLS